ncbi:hypothetical protein GW17_00057521 [Ensete ventricosum]|nr:hypothetical protein GW17_00057521 [Ensete ventricosum]
MGVTHGQLGIGPRGSHTYEALARGSRAWPRPAPLQGATGCSQGPHTRGRLAAAKAPLQRGSRLRPGPLQRAASRRGSSPWGMIGCSQAARACCLLQGRKWQPRSLGCRLQGRSLAGVAASRGSTRARRCRQPARCRPKAAAPAARAAAHVDGVQCRHLRRAAATAA